MDRDIEFNQNEPLISLPVFGGIILDMNKEEAQWIEHCRTSEDPDSFSIFITKKYYRPSPLIKLDPEKKSE